MPDRIDYRRWNVTRLEMEAWRNFSRQTEIRLRGRTFFVGPNASGKSNILDAFRFLRDVAGSGRRSGFVAWRYARGAVAACQAVSGRPNRGRRGTSRRQRPVVLRVALPQSSESAPSRTTCGTRCRWCDLDHDECAPARARDFLAAPASGMCFRIAERAVEAWLLADRASIARFLSVSGDLVSPAPERLPAPKSHLVSLASGREGAEPATGNDARSELV